MVETIRETTCSAEYSGCWASTSAATPETNGAANEVPAAKLMYSPCESSPVVVSWTPGAARLTVVAP